MFLNNHLQKVQVRKICVPVSLEYLNQLQQFLSKTADGLNVIDRIAAADKFDRDSELRVNIGNMGDEANSLQAEF